MAEIMYIHKLDGTMKDAHNCPYCHREGGRLESQDIELNDNKTAITITNAWTCAYCSETWWQEIEAAIGQVTKNIVVDGEG